MTILSPHRKVRDRIERQLTPLGVVPLYRSGPFLVTFGVHAKWLSYHCRVPYFIYDDGEPYVILRFEWWQRNHHKLPQRYLFAEILESEWRISNDHSN